MSRALRLTEEQFGKLVRKRTGRRNAATSGGSSTSSGSKLERRLEQQLLSSGFLPASSGGGRRSFYRNYFPFPDRDFELDFAWPELKVAVEVQGMAHRIKSKFKRDIEKRALLLLNKWRVLEVDGDSIRDGRALRWVSQLIEQEAYPTCITID